MLAAQNYYAKSRTNGTQNFDTFEVFLFEEFMLEPYRWDCPVAGCGWIIQAYTQASLLIRVDMHITMTHRTLEPVVSRVSDAELAERAKHGVYDTFLLHESDRVFLRNVGVAVED
jgi:predicted small metal-binding protein